MGKCCKKCAFRHGSPERRDDWGWLFMQESFRENGHPFYCHESAPGHYQEVKDGRPRMRLCAGFEATRAMPLMKLMRRTALDEQPRP